MNELVAVLRASADSMLDPQVLLEAIRGPDRRVVDFRYRSVNRAACAYLGVEESDLIGHAQDETSPNLKGSELHRRFAQCLADGEPLVLDDFAYFNEILDGARRYDLRATRAGADLISLTWRDVTDRFDAAQRIADSELKYRLIALNSGDVVLHARDGKIAWISPSVQDVLGAPPEHWVGRELRDAVPAEDLAGYAERLKVIEAGGTTHRRVRLVAVDGAHRWIDVSAKPFFDADGHRDGVLATLRLADHDVVIEQQIEEARRQQARADALFRRAMDNAAIGMALIAPNGGFVDVNPALCSLFGYDARTLTTKTWQELTAPEFLEADLTNVNDMLEGRSDSYRMLKQYFHADGHRIWGDLSVSCVRDDKGQLENFISQIVDVTATIQATERYRLLAENVADVVLRADAGGTIVWISPSVERALGAPPEYWIGRKAREAVPPEDAPVAAARLAKALSGEVVKERLRVVSADGAIHWAHMHGTAFYDADGRPDGVTAVLRLIDDEVAAQLEVEKARRQQARADARYRRAMDTAAIGMCLLAPDGTFIEVNPALCEFFGYDAETLTQKKWQDLTPPEFLDVGDEARRAVFDGRQDSYRLIKQYFHADGYRIWADVAVNCVRDEHGQVEHLASQIADITEEVHTRERLKQSDEQNRLLAQRLQEQSDRLAAELKTAADYMASIMPRGLSGRVNVQSYYLPSRELSGDCFDYTWIDEDHLLVYLIDVSGHGIEPALLSVSVHNMLRSGSLGSEIVLSPEDALAELNRLFQMREQGDHYFTVWYGIYQASSRTLRFASAGAPPALAFGPAVDGAVQVTELSTAATPVGMFEDTVFTSGSYSVPPGCRILIYSDGAHEITLDSGRQFSWGEFKSLSTRLVGSPDWSLDILVRELRALTPGGPFEDDCSLIDLTFT
jgi:PAS domain S-box-containing protein